MMELKEDYILHMKFLLYCFEWMSGLKINYYKSEVFVVGVNQEDAQSVANKLDCNLGKFPLTYLGIAIGDKDLKGKASANMISKLENRLSTWKSRLLSSGGRLVLVNSCLSSIPTFTMSFYKLTEETHKRMDSIRARFFWRGVSNSFKYHMVKWRDVCRPKDFGGLGVIDTRLFNICLLCKWHWRMSQARNELWFRILKAKYIDIDHSNGCSRNGSQFWRNLQGVLPSTVSARL